MNISEKTNISLVVVVSLLGFAGWLTMIFFQGQANAQAITELKVKQDAISLIQTDIAVIKSEVSDIKVQLDAKGGISVNSIRRSSSLRKGN